MSKTNFTRENVCFHSQDTQCHAWLYQPVQAIEPRGPCVVMAHGLGGTRAGGLEPFAERFAEVGLRVLVFDYRHFGDSDGQPRQLLTISRQQADWRAAIAYVRSLRSVDSGRIALWGTSLSAGHVTSIAAKDARIAAVVAQNPMLDGLASVFMLLRNAGPWQLLKLSTLGLLDLLRSASGRPPLLIPVVAREGELAAMSTAGAYAGVMVTAPAGWRNEMSARFALTLGLYRPVSVANKIQCPILIQACMQDSVACPKAAMAAAKLAPAAEIRRYEKLDHFDIYQGGALETAITDQVEFLQRVLRLGKSVPAASTQPRRISAAS
ncbi:alpha/beta hydrolase [Pseudomonas vranovensis]|uniref:alpha/beta hydrolase n=1 Tax=Pseudomonas vranovensis TaxID=321661 RepID=UPI003D96B45A